MTTMTATMPMEHEESLLDQIWEKTSSAVVATGRAIKRAITTVPWGAVAGVTFWSVCGTINAIEGVMLATMGLGLIGALYGVFFVMLGGLGFWLAYRSFITRSFLG